MDIREGVSISVFSSLPQGAPGAPAHISSHGNKKVEKLIKVHSSVLLFQTRLGRGGDIRIVLEE